MAALPARRIGISVVLMSASMHPVEAFLTDEEYNLKNAWQVTNGWLFENSLSYHMESNVVEQKIQDEMLHLVKQVQHRLQAQEIPHQMMKFEGQDDDRYPSLDALAQAFNKNAEVVATHIIPKDLRLISCPECDFDTDEAQIKCQTCNSELKIDRDYLWSKIKKEWEVQKESAEVENPMESNPQSFCTFDFYAATESMKVPNCEVSPDKFGFVENGFEFFSHVEFGQIEESIPAWIRKKFPQYEEYAFTEFASVTRGLGNSDYAKTVHLDRPFVSEAFLNILTRGLDLDKKIKLELRHHLQDLINKNDIGQTISLWRDFNKGRPDSVLGLASTKDDWCFYQPCNPQNTQHLGLKMACLRYGTNNGLLVFKASHVWHSSFKIDEDDRVCRSSFEHKYCCWSENDIFVLQKEVDAYIDRLGIDNGRRGLQGQPGLGVQDAQ